MLDLTQPQIDEKFDPFGDLFGFYELEYNSQFPYRWSSDYAFVQMPFGYHLAPRYVATVRAQAGMGKPNPLIFLGNERPVASVTPTDVFRVYRLLLPPAPPGDANVRLELQTQPRTLNGDNRPLGVVLSDIELRGLPHTNWPAQALLPVAFGLIWGLARWRGARIRDALLICVPLGAALLSLYAFAGPGPLSYATLAAASLGAAAVAMLIARQSYARLSLALLGTLISFSGMIWSTWLSDDVFISFRYAQNLVAGNGLVYNPGERVEGYTNFLYTMLAALVLRLGGDPVYWTYLSGVGFALGLLLLTYWLAARLLGSSWALVAALLVATSQSLLLHSARGGGLETALYALLLLTTVAVYLGALRGRGQVNLALAITGVLLALATLTRPEGALLLMITAFHYTAYDLAGVDLRPGAIARTIRHKGGLGALIGPYMLLIVPFFIWRYTYYGDLLPNTFYAKVGGGLRALPRGLAYSWGFAQTMGGPLLLLCLAGLIPDWRGALRSWRGYILLLLGVYTVYIIAVGGDVFRGERFFVPLVSLVAILFADGLAQIVRTAMARPTLRLVTPVLVAVLLSVYSLYALERTRSIDYIIKGMDESVWLYREIGWWMADHAGPDESIAVIGAGAIAYYGQHTTIDMLGLTDHHIARVVMPNMGAGAAGHEKSDPAYVINERRPTYIPDLWQGYFTDQTELRANYYLITIKTRYGRDLVMWKRRS
ncbi:hypothetical protein K2Z83_03255 [Oscillochloris sp. ZM17-4]|uniref:hypothetical protein n=1 Tax=Oscillochloris sp. ZM17-4 TaxID=2866714 RepID=UPI001C73B898|nr:hypothetical protein [Oscillochloris sp. ZM17-4]MBX0326700.1 hypothetical protein [Oscillochloris sp. ZM17-4]